MFLFSLALFPLIIDNPKQQILEKHSGTIHLHIIEQDLYKLSNEYLCLIRNLEILSQSKLSLINSVHWSNTAPVVS
jgi:hypothetical protein